jgi:hypothetical protein
LKGLEIERKSKGGIYTKLTQGHNNPKATCCRTLWSMLEQWSSRTNLDFRDLSSSPVDRNSFGSCRHAIGLVQSRSILFGTCFMVAFGFVASILSATNEDVVDGDVYYSEKHI